MKKLSFDNRMCRKCFIFLRWQVFQSDLIFCNIFFRLHNFEAKITAASSDAAVIFIALITF